MIEEIRTIKGIGRFSDFKAGKFAWDGMLGRFTVVYAENGKGKTTLAAVLRSFQSGDTQELEQRKSIGVAAGAEVEIVLDGAKVTCAPGTSGWSATYPNLEVFDAHFVNQNIYSGLEISAEHRRELHKFVLGPQGVKLVGEVEQCKKDIAATRDALRGLDLKLVPIVGIGVTPENFCSLTQDLDVDGKISATKKEIGTATAEKEILTKSKFATLKRVAPPLTEEQLLTICKASADGIHEDFLRLVEEHKSRFNEPAQSESWLQFGLENIHENQCPFCGQDLTAAKNLLEAYRQYFNAEYARLQTAISDGVASIAAFSPGSAGTDMKLTKAKNDALDAFWSLHVTVVTRNTPSDDSMEKLQIARDALLNVLAKKKSSPLAVAEDASVGDFFKAISVVNTEVDSHNEAVEEANKAIDQLKSRPAQDLSKLQARLAGLELQKKRFEGSTDALCIDRTRVAGDLTRLNTDKDTKKATLDSYSATVLGKYATAINTHLAQLTTDFLIGGSFASKFTGTATNPTAEYELVLDGCPVSFDETGGGVCVKHALSDGDKNSLALAFFLARLELEPAGELVKKIVVVDDPLASHDVGRQTRTKELLSALAPKLKQLIVLTHSPYFALDMKRGLSKSTSQPTTTLAINRANKTSAITSWDFEKELAGEYLRSYFELEEFLSNGAPSDKERRALAASIRLVVEGFIRVKYPSKLGELDNLGRMIDRLSSKTPDPELAAMTAKAKDLTQLNDYSKKYHHDNPGYDKQPINDSELQSYVRQAIALIQS